LTRTPLLSAQTYALDRKVFYHNNLLGSPVAATDESGTLCWREDYRPYGEKIRNEDQGCGLDDNVVGYTGHVHDGDIGLTYMQARYYDPIVGRFMGVDPVGFSTSRPVLFNRFAYANNNPYKYVDGNGEIAFLAVIGFAYAAMELALTIADVVDAASTLGDEEASDSDKVLAVGAVIAGIALPGNGRAYKGAAEALTGTKKRGGNPWGSKGKPDHQGVLVKSGVWILIQLLPDCPSSPRFHL